MDRPAELAEIERFIAARGATRCPAAFACTVAAALPREQEAARLAGLSVEATLSFKKIKEDLWRGLVSGRPGRRGK